ncbi:MAG TPA: hypothetical protein VHB69_01090 [Mycobacteriales bacterium]|nr:hypothetical protein [Mycobacteriales bacterium]
MSEESRPGASRRSRSRALLTAAAATLVVADLLVAAVRSHDVAASRSRLEHSLPPSARSAMQAAEIYAIDFATYTYGDLDAAFAKTEAHSIDPFLSQYRKETAQLRATLVQAKASSTATVVSEGVASLTADSAVVDLFLNQTVKNTGGTHVDAQRVEMTLQWRNHTWLISEVVLP